MTGSQEPVMLSLKVSLGEKLVTQTLTDSIRQYRNNLSEDVYKLWETGFPKRENCQLNTIVFIFAPFSWQGIKMLEHLSQVVDNFVAKGGQMKVHILNGATLMYEDYSILQKEYSPLPGSGGRGESFLLKNSLIKYIHGGLSNQDPINDLNNFDSEFKRLYEEV